MSAAIRHRTGSRSSARQQAKLLREQQEAEEEEERQLAEQENNHDGILHTLLLMKFGQDAPPESKIHASVMSGSANSNNNNNSMDVALPAAAHDKEFFFPSRMLRSLSGANNNSMSYADYSVLQQSPVNTSNSLCATPVDDQTEEFTTTDSSLPAPSAFPSSSSFTGRSRRNQQRSHSHSQGFHASSPSPSLSSSQGFLETATQKLPFCYYTNVVSVITIPDVQYWNDQKPRVSSALSYTFR